MFGLTHPWGVKSVRKNTNYSTYEPTNFVAD